MITKGIIEEILSPYSARVRLPIFDSIKEAQNSVTTGNLRIASICSLPNCTNLLAVNDIVFVGFEDDDLGKPIILGNLVREQTSIANPAISGYSLDIEKSVNIPGNININNTDSIDLTQLIGLKCNVQAALNQITANISDIPTKFLTSQDIKTLKTNNISAQSTSSSESIVGSGTINLHRVAKTGSYSDLNGKPNIPSALSWQTPASVSEIVNAIMWKVSGQILDIHQIWGTGSGAYGTVAVEEQQANSQGAAYISISETANTINVKGALYADNTTTKLVWINETNISVTLSDWKVLK